MNHKPEIGGYLGSTFTSILATIQTNEVFQIIEIILACVSFAVSIAYTIYKWYKNAKKDGKITKDEVEDLFDDVNKEIKDHKEGK